MEEHFDFTYMQLNRIIKREEQIYENVANLKNQHKLEVDRMKQEFHNELQKLKSDHKTSDIKWVEQVIHSKKYFQDPLVSSWNFFGC